MPKPGKAKGPKSHDFRNKLLLNQWLLSLFGIDPLSENERRPFHLLAEPIKDPKLEGLDAENLHYFYHYLGDSPLFRDEGPGVMIPGFRLDRSLLLQYEENIVRHTLAINQRRARPVVWKYYQWLTLLFAEIYLDRFFNNRDGLLADVNAYTDRFNQHWAGKGYERLARYGRGYSVANLKNFRQFFLIYPDRVNAIRHPAGSELVTPEKRYPTGSESAGTIIFPLPGRELLSALTRTISILTWFFTTSLSNAFSSLT